MIFKASSGLNCENNLYIELPAVAEAVFDDILNMGLTSESQLKGSDLRRNLNTGRVLLVLRQKRSDDRKYRDDSIRVVSVKDAVNQKLTIGKAYNYELKKFIALQGDEKFDGYEVVGKITTTQPTRNVDLYFESLEELKSLKSITDLEYSLSSQSDTKKMADAKRSQQEIDKLLTPTEEEYQQATDEVFGQARESGEDLTADQEIDLEKRRDDRAKEIAKERVEKLQS